ncbi:MAG: enoyl-CoA hydratase/isomerase family protein [Gammaproteobacteria bacterium]
MAYEQYPHVKVTMQDNIAIVSLNRPEALNSVNPELHRDLEYIWIDLARDEAVKAIVVTGEGKAFSAGGDIKRMAERAGTDAGIRHALNIPAGTRRIFQNLLEVPQPVICAVNGDCIGIGATIALFCDMSVIAEDASFGDPHTKVGLAAGDGGAVIWPMLIGHQRAKEYLLLGRVIKGREAERIGLVNYALPAADVVPKAMELARELVKLPVFAVQFTKHSVNKHLREAVLHVLDASIAYEGLTQLSHDYGEATKAWTEKRKPVYKGF